MPLPKALADKLALRRHALDQSPIEKYGATLLVLLAFVGTFGVLKWDPALSAPSSESSLSKRRLYVAVRPPVLPSLIDDPYAEHVHKVLNVIQRSINPDTQLATSFIGDKRLETWSVVYDNAVRAMMHLRTGRVDLAKKTIDYFIENTAIQKMGWVVKNGKHVARSGWIINIVDASEVGPGGRAIEHIAHTGPNAYLGIASIHIYRATHEKKYLRFARKRWELIKDLQNENPGDPNCGGVRMGPMGNPKNSHEQKMDFKSQNPSFYELYSGEHAADFKGFSDLMAQIDKVKKERYEHASDLIAQWDKHIYDASKHLFLIGTTEKKYFDTSLGQWIQPGLIPLRSLDTNALKISAYGVVGLEQFEPHAAEKIRHAIDENFKVTVEISAAAGKPRKITGYDFLSHEDRKQLGRKPLLTDEWSNRVALADLRLADDFRKIGNKRKSETYLSAYYENALVEGLMTAISIDGGLAYPDCHPLQYAHDRPYALIGGAARVLGMLRFDPLRLDGGDQAINVDPSKTR